MLPQTYQSKAWLLDGAVHSLPGLLRLADGELRYVAFGSGSFSAARLAEIAARFGHPRDAADALMEGAPFPLLRARAAEIQRFAIPWYYFKGGAKLDLPGGSFRFSFLKPQNALEPPDFDGWLREWLGEEGLDPDAEIGEGRAAGKAWEALFREPPR